MDEKPTPPPEAPKGRDWAKIAQEGLARLLSHRQGWGPAALAGGAAALFAVLFVWIYIYWGLPSVPDAQSLWSLNRQPGVTFLDRDGRTLGVRGPYYGQRAAMRDLPSYVPNAFLAIEDRRFYEHEGVDRAAIVRAFFANIAAGRTVQGGSTITQQLARNLFLTPSKTMQRKMQEMLLASRIEQLLSKDQILELYMNRIYLGEQAYGIDAASRRYFGKPATELTLAEAAMLAGLPKAPSRSAPTVNLERAKERQRLVLDAMVEAGWITSEQRDNAANAPIRIVRGNGEGPLGYVFDMAFAEACNRIGRNERATDIADETSLCPPEQGKRERYPPAVGDLVIRVTLDRDLQEEAVDAVRRRLGAFARNRQHPLQGAFVAMDREGGVRALVGGANYSASKFNRVTQALRQPGSSFKAFVYAAALAEGMDTEDVRFDEPVVIHGWRPRNYDEGYMGAVTLRTAFALSINTVAAQVADEVGPRNVANLAKTFGVATMPPSNEWVPPSIALGTIEVTLWDMTKAFSVFMHEGLLVEPHLVDRIENTSGELLYQYESSPPQRVYDPDLAQRMTSMLGAVVLNGTGTRAQLQGRDAAGKTGTSQDWRDAWFIGYTADYVAGAWVGFDDSTSMNRVRGLGRVTGGAYPTEIWQIVMNRAHRRLEPHALAGIDQPSRSPRQLELANFYNLLKEAFGGDDYPAEAEPPPDEFFQ